MMVVLLFGLAQTTGAQNQYCVVKSTLRSQYEGDSSNGGFIAHVASGNTIIIGCLFEGKLIGLNDGQTSNYFTPIAGSQGKQAYSITSGTEGLTVDAPKVSIPYDVSGIEVLGNMGESAIKLRDIIYGGKDDQIKLIITCPAGYEISNLKAQNAQNEDFSEDGWVTMDDKNCIITADLTFGTLTLLADGGNYSVIPL